MCQPFCRQSLYRCDPNLISNVLSNILEPFPGTSRCSSATTGQIMLGWHQNSRRTWDSLVTKMAKLAVTGELVDKVVCSSYVTHQKVISGSWILAITRAFSPLTSVSSTTVLTAKTVVEFVNFTREWPISQLDPPLAASLCRLVVIHLMASYVIGHSCESVACHSWNFHLMQTFAKSHGNLKRSRPCRRSVTNRSQSITGQWEVGHKSVTAVETWLWFWDPSLCQ